MVTAGANQAFTNVAIALLDASDKAVLFSPYYFNHLMAVQVRYASLTVSLLRVAAVSSLTIDGFHFTEGAYCCHCCIADRGFYG